MARSPLTPGGNNTTGAALSATPWYAPLGGPVVSTASVEAEQQFRFAVAGTVDRPGFYSVSSAGVSRTVAVRKNGSTGLSYTAPDGAAGAYFSTSGSVSVSSGDLVALMASASTTAGTVNSLIANFKATTGHAYLLQTSPSPALSLAITGSRTLAIHGTTLGNSNGSMNGRMIARIGGTLKGAFVYIPTNSKTTDTTVTLAVNNVDTTIVVTVPAGTTGFFTSANTATFSSGDDLAWRIVTGSGEAFTVASLGVTVDVGSGAQSDIYSRPTGTLNRAASATASYAPINGQLAFSTTEGQKQVALGFPARLSLFRAYLTAVAYDAVATIRVNGVATALTFALTTGVTGLYEDSVDTVDVAASDLISIEITGTGTGNNTFTHFGLTVEDITPLSDGTGAASGVGTASGVGASIAATTGSASGVGTATGAAFAPAPPSVDTTGSAVGTSTALAIGAFTGASIGTASGSSSVIAVSNAAPPSRINAGPVTTIEITAAVDGAGTLQSFYASDRRFATQPTDTPANVPFNEGILDSGSLSLSAFGNRRTSGATRLAAGQIRLTNINGQFDDWRSYGFDGRPLVIRRGTPGAYPADFRTLFTGTVDAIQVDMDEVVLKLRDKQLMFDRRALSSTYAGTNALPDGVEGTEDDLRGKPKPRLYGQAFNVAPPCVNTSKLVYQVSDGEISSVDAVYDRGQALAFASNFANPTALLAATVAGGTFATCAAFGLFRLGSAPGGQITADATQGTGAASRTAAQILFQLGTAAGLLSGEISTTDVSALDAANSSPLGLWVSGEDTFTALMDNVAGSVGAYYGFDSSGVLRMGRLTPPEGSPVLSLTEDDIFKPFERLPANDGDIPAWAYTIRHSRLWTVQGNDLAGGVSPARRAALATEYRAERAENLAIRSQFLLAPEEAFDTLFISSDPALAEAERRLTMHGTRRDFFRAPVRADLLTQTELRLLDVVQLTHPRFGLSGGRLFRLLGFTLELKTNRAILILWG